MIKDGKMTDEKNDRIYKPNVKKSWSQKFERVKLTSKC